MIVRAVKTSRIKPGSKSLTEFLDEYIQNISEGSVIAITSKVVSICEGALVPYDLSKIEDLVRSEADYYLRSNDNRHRITIKQNILSPKAGIDVSAGKKYFILWPRNPQKTANEIRQYLSKKFGVKNLGIIITDSVTKPTTRGVSGVSLAHSGFYATKKSQKETRTNIAYGLAAAAVVVMGEGNELTPIAVIEDVPFVEFNKNNPNEAELKLIKPDLSYDIYSALLNSPNWERIG